MEATFNIIRPDFFIKKEISQFLERCGLKLDPHISYFVEARKKNELIACAGLDGNIVKCVAVDPNFRHEGILIKLIGLIYNLASANGIYDLYLCTKPENISVFQKSGFYPLIHYKDKIAFMTSNPQKLKEFCFSIKNQLNNNTEYGAIIMKADPFTKGHRYLIEQALLRCASLCIFVVSENSGLFSFKDRFSLVKAGTQDLPGIKIFPAGEYMISKMTFPSYFLRETESRADYFDLIDILLFRNYIAPAANIKIRFVGSEPYDEVTSKYNKHLSYYLQATTEFPSIDLVEIPRLTYNNMCISADYIRTAFINHELSKIRGMVPSSTFDFLAARL